MYTILIIRSNFENEEKIVSEVYGFILASVGEGWINWDFLVLLTPPRRETAPQRLEMGDQSQDAHLLRHGRAGSGKIGKRYREFCQLSNVFWPKRGLNVIRFKLWDQIWNTPSFLNFVARICKDLHILNFWRPIAISKFEIAGPTDEVFRMGPILVSRAFGSKINQKMECDTQNKFWTSVGTV